MADTIIKVEDLRISFRTVNGVVQAVRGVNFDVKRGETVAIVGESGSGKSVTMKALMGILPPNAFIEEGSISYSGMDLTKVDEKTMHTIRGKRIGLIFQDPLSALNPIMRVGKQITEVLRKRGLNASEAKKEALDLIRAVGIPDPERSFAASPFQFSGGMRQRIVIAIALAGDPEVLICDEPTTALDVTVQAKILDLINHIKEERGLSVIFITHDLGVVANMADRVNVMYAGKIVEAGTSEEIFFTPVHPYTWALLESMPDLQTKGRLQAIPGAPPNMIAPPPGDAFAPRSSYALKIDYEKEPPVFRLTDTHVASTWLLHPKAPKLEMPDTLKARIERMKKEAEKYGG